MSKLVWGQSGTKEFEVGVKHGVLFLYDETTHKWLGTAWQGLTNVTESPEGGDAEDFYADDSLYASIRGTEKLSGSIECYMYPPEFDDCIGHVELMAGVRIGQQSRKTFCMAYESTVGNDVNPEAGKKYHLIYNATAGAAEMSHDTTEESVDLEPFSFDFTSVPIAVTDHKPTSSLTIDSRTLTTSQITKLEAAIYGSNDADAYLPLPDALKTLLAE